VAPTDRQSKEDYFDSLYHAHAVIGLNTSALVDSAIVRRPVFTIIQDRFRETQTGTLHFSYLARNGEEGVLNVARAWDEHLEQLGSAVQAPDLHHERIERFVGSFIRPQGIDRPAAPLAIAAVERTAAAPKETVDPRGPLRRLVGAIASALGGLHLLRERVRPSSLRRRRAKRRRQRARMKRKQARRRQGTPSSKPAKAREKAGAPR
jgi:hypothetical protein